MSSMMLTLKVGMLSVIVAIRSDLLKTMFLPALKCGTRERRANRIILGSAKIILNKVTNVRVSNMTEIRALAGQKRLLDMCKFCLNN